MIAIVWSHTAFWPPLLMFHKVSLKSILYSAALARGPMSPKVSQYGTAAYHGRVVNFLLHIYPHAISNILNLNKTNMLKRRQKWLLCTHGGPSRPHDRKMPVEFLSLKPVYKVIVLCKIRLSEHMSHHSKW